jgi:hypothetical protein
MTLKDWYTEDASRTAVRRSLEAADQPRKASTPVVDPRAIVRADRGCCCAAKPSVIVIMPPTPSRPHQTDLLLCWHHYRASRQALARAGAAVLAADGMAVADVEWLVGSGA